MGCAGFYDRRRQVIQFLQHTCTDYFSSKLYLIDSYSRAVGTMRPAVGDHA
jgi:hypothetical protein